MHLYVCLFMSGLLLMGIAFPNKALACESCLISRVGKDGAVRSESADKKWFVEYLFEQKNYAHMDAADAHHLHHLGHEVHVKTTEDFHHFIIGRNITSRFSLSAEIPYVIRRALEVDNHATLGSKQRAEGLGDTTLLGEYDFWESETQSIGLVGGVKFPTGYTGEKNSVGGKFEAEMQPGSGSFDYILGGVYRAAIDRVNLVGNTTYVFNNEGVYDFQFGNMWTLSTAADYLLNPTWNKLQTRLGVDVVYQYEGREKQHGMKNPDSGGATLLAGPVLNIVTLPSTSISASVLFPAYQDLGGFHQELDYLWTLGAKVTW